MQSSKRGHKSFGIKGKFSTIVVVIYVYGAISVNYLIKRLQNKHLSYKCLCISYPRDIMDMSSCFSENLTDSLTTAYSKR